jgi:hypothetical protein
MRYEYRGEELGSELVARDGGREHVIWGYTGHLRRYVSPANHGYELECPYTQREALLAHFATLDGATQSDYYFRIRAIRSVRTYGFGIRDMKHLRRAHSVEVADLANAALSSFEDDEIGHFGDIKSMAPYPGMKPEVQLELRTGEYGLPFVHLVFWGPDGTELQGVELARMLATLDWRGA